MSSILNTLRNCNLVIDKYNDDITALEKAKVKLIEENKNGVDRITRSIRTIKDQRIIEFLSKNNLIPFYLMSSILNTLRNYISATHIQVIFLHICF